MNLHPFDQVVINAQNKMRQGWKVYQQWLCEHCGTKQTMTEGNHFYTEGICEECNGVTDIKKAGCNFMGIWGGASVSDQAKGEGVSTAELLGRIIKEHGGDDGG